MLRNVLPNRRKNYRGPSGRTVSRRLTGGSGEYRRRQRFWQTKRFKIWLILGVIGLFFLCYLIFWTGIFSIDTIEVRGNQAISSQEIEQIITEQSDKRRWALFSQNNILFFNTATAAATIDQRYILDSVAVKKRAPQRILIELQERDSQATWVTGDQYYTIDPNGIILKQLPVANVVVVTGEAGEEAVGGEELLDLSAVDQSRPIIIDDAAQSVDVGQTAVDAQQLVFIDYLHQQLPQENITPERYRIPEEGSSDVFVDTTAGYALYFDSTDQHEQQLINLRAILKNKIQADSTIEYIDLRFGEKVYIK